MGSAVDKFRARAKCFGAERERERRGEGKQEQELSYLIKRGLLAGDGCVTRHKARQEKGEKEKREKRRKGSRCTA